MKLGARLRRLRQDLRISQGEVARRTGLQASYLSKVENGVLLPGLENLASIARAMGTDLAGVFARERGRPFPSRASRGRNRGSGRAGAPGAKPRAQRN